MDPEALGRLQRAGARDVRGADRARSARRPAVEPREVYEITVCGNVTMMQLALGIDPEPLSMAPFVVTTNSFPETRASDFGVRVHPRAPAFVFPSLGAYVGGDIVAGMLATGLTRDRRLRLFIDVGTNSRDRARLERARAGDRRARRAGLRGRADQVRHARRRRRDRGRQDRRRRAAAAGDRRRRAGRHVRLGPRRRRRRARARRAARPLGPVHRRGGGGELASWAGRALRDDRRGAGLRPRAGAARTRRTRSSSPSATSASCSSPRRRSRPAGRSCCATSASRPRRSRRCCWPAASAPTSRR